MSMEDISALKSLESRVRKLGELHDNGVGRSADNDIRREMWVWRGEGADVGIVWVFLETTESFFQDIDDTI